MLTSTRQFFYFSSFSFVLLEKLSLVRQPLKEKRHRDHVFLFFLRWQRKSTPTRREKDPPRSGSLRVFCYCFFFLADDHRSFFPLPSWFISAVRVRRYPVLFRRRCRAYAFQRHRYNSLQRCRRRDTRSVCVQILHILHPDVYIAR